MADPSAIVSSINTYRPALQQALGADADAFFAAVEKLYGAMLAADATQDTQDQTGAALLHLVDQYPAAGQLLRRVDPATFAEGAPVSPAAAGDAAPAGPAGPGGAPLGVSASGPGPDAAPAVLGSAAPGPVTTFIPPGAGPSAAPPDQGAPPDDVPGPVGPGATVPPGPPTQGNAAPGPVPTMPMGPAPAILGTFASGGDAASPPPGPPVLRMSGPGPILSVPTAPDDVTPPPAVPAVPPLPVAPPVPAPVVGGGPGPGTPGDLAMEQRTQWLKEQVAAGLGILLVAGTVLIAFITILFRNASDIQGAKDILLLLSSLSGVVLGYYFGRIPSDARAAQAQQTASQAQQDAAAARGQTAAIGDQADQIAQQMGQMATQVLQGASAATRGLAPSVDDQVRQLQELQQALHNLARQTRG